MPCFNDHLAPIPAPSHVQPAESIPQCLAALEGLASAKPGDPRFAQADQLAYSTMVAQCRLRNDSFGNPLADWHSWDVAVRDDDGKLTGDRKPRERDRRGSRLTRPNASDVDVKLAHAVRVSGLLGFVMLPSRAYTANGRPTRNVPSNVSGLPPQQTSEPLARVIHDHMLLSDPELRHLRKYRYAMKGEKFAESMERERRERELAYEREASPYLPRNKAGKVLAYYFTSSGVIFSDGTTLRERVESWKAHNSEHVNDMRQRSSKLARQAELDALIAEQADDDAETKRKSRKVRERNIAVTALRFK